MSAPEYIKNLVSDRVVVVYIPSKSYNTTDFDEVEFRLKTADNIETYYRRVGEVEELVRRLSKVGAYDIEVMALPYFLNELQDEQFYIGEGQVKIVEVGQGVNAQYYVRAYEGGNLVIMNDLNG